MLVEAITVQVRKQFADIQCQCVLLGAEQLIVEWGGKKTAPWWVTILKTVCVSLIILTGSAFTIMTYDQDVDVAGVFGRIYQLFVGHVPTPVSYTHLDVYKRQDKWILSKMNRLTKDVTENIDKYELGIAVSKIYDFIWEEFCDWYIEMVKPRLYNDEDKTKAAALWLSLIHI